MRAGLQNRYIRGPTEVNSGFSSKIGEPCACLNRDGWTFCKGFRWVWGHAPPEEKLKLEVIKLLGIHWNCQFYHHYVILYHFKYFTTPSGGPFWFFEGRGGGGGECVRRLRAWVSYLFGNLYQDVSKGRLSNPQRALNRDKISKKICRLLGGLGHAPPPPPRN